MPTVPVKIPDNIDFAAQELLEAPADHRPAMLENIAKALNSCSSSPNLCGLNETPSGTTEQSIVPVLPVSNPVED
jgi:hypothetical protein